MAINGACANEPVTHCIFDCDGVVLDTEKLYFQCLDEIAHRYGGSFTYELQVKMMGRRRHEAIEMFMDHYECPAQDAEKIAHEYETRLAELLPECKVFPAAEKLIRHLRASRIPMAIATGSDKYSFQIKSKNHGDLMAMFENIVLSDDPCLKRSKPAPDIYLLAMSRFQHQPKSSKQVLVIEDSPNGVLAAFNANMRIVMVPCVPVSFLDEDILSKADFVLPSLADLPLEVLGWPKMPD